MITCSLKYLIVNNTLVIAIAKVSQHHHCGVRCAAASGNGDADSDGAPRRQVSNIILILSLPGPCNSRCYFRPLRDLRGSLPSGAATQGAAARLRGDTGSEALLH